MKLLAGQNIVRLKVKIINVKPTGYFTFSYVQAIEFKKKIMFGCMPSMDQ